jgi:hypothetical protein
MLDVALAMEYAPNIDVADRLSEGEPSAADRTAVNRVR